MLQRASFGTSLRRLLTCVLLLLGALPLLVASPAPAAQGERSFKPPVHVGFGAAAFKFTIIVKDNGQDASSGWQEATAKLMFAQPKEKTEDKDKKDKSECAPDSNSGDTMDGWTCTVRVGLPIRHSSRGVISSDYAAAVTAEMATQAGLTKRASNETVAEYCRNFVIRTDKFFNDTYKNNRFGQRINLGA